jgi:hypothetical protein
VTLHPVTLSHAVTLRFAHAVGVPEHVVPAVHVQPAPSLWTLSHVDSASIVHGFAMVPPQGGRNVSS